MSEPDPPRRSDDREDAGLWPEAAYRRQVERLRQALGSWVYVVEVSLSRTHAGVSVEDQMVELLDVVSFPRPDPARRLYPHTVLLGDGRGLNLGRVARISVNRAFAPSPQDVLYQEPFLVQELLHGPRRLTRERVQRVTRVALAQLLGEAPRLEHDPDD